MVKVQRTYDMFRRRYFLDGERCPPLAKDIEWAWHPELSGDLGVTTWDHDEDPESVTLNHALRHWPDMLKVTILHEMTHMRLGVDSRCPSMAKNKSAQPTWTREMTRLASLGAPLL
jgi:hypothetical protein